MNLPTRLFAALPDAITAALFLVAWVDPERLGAEWVKNLMLVMLIEFVVMHSSGFYAMLAGMDDASRSKRLLMLTGLTLFYLAFIAAFAFAFHASWPLFAFGWLFLSRFMHILLRAGQAAADEAGRLLMLWVASGASYLAGALATVLLPLPALGLNPPFVATMHLEGSGEWIERPYTVIAFGLLYFAVQAWVKYRFAGRTGGIAAHGRRS
jgi:hypothetical protein